MSRLVRRCYRSELLSSYCVQMTVPTLKTVSRVAGKRKKESLVHINLKKYAPEVKHHFYWYSTVQNLSIWSRLVKKKPAECLALQLFLIQLYHIEEGESGFQRKLVISVTIFFIEYLLLHQISPVSPYFTLKSINQDSRNTASCYHDIHTF